jgi:hypothetical protein
MKLNRFTAKQFKIHIFNKYEIFVWFKLVWSFGTRIIVTQFGPNFIIKDYILLNYVFYKYLFNLIIKIMNIY